MVLELMPHQIKAVREMHNGCILIGGVGTGKTITSLMYYYTKVCGGIPQIKNFSFKPMERPKDLYVITTARKRDDLDWPLEAAYFGIGREINQDGVRMHVDSWNNIADYENVTDAFFIFDENRVVGKGAWVASFLRIAAANEWVVLSATPGDVWMDYLPVFLANGFYKNKSQFIDNHVEFDRFAKYPKVRRYHGERKLDHFRNQILVDMPFERHTIRNEHHVIVPFNEFLFRRVTKDRWNVFEDRPLVNAAELQIAMRRVVNEDPSRWGEIQRIYEKHRRVILFYNFNYELDILRAGLDTLGIVYSEWNGQRHQPVPEGDDWVYLVQYTAGAEAWNCIRTDCIAYYSLNYSYKVFEQSKGRIDRLNTPYRELHYYIIRSTSQIDTSIWKTLTTKKNFNERAYARDLWNEAESLERSYDGGQKAA